jgi:hypothetical protein
VFRIFIGVVVIAGVVAAVWCAVVYAIIPLVKYFQNVDFPKPVTPDSPSGGGGGSSQPPATPSAGPVVAKPLVNWEDVKGYGVYIFLGIIGVVGVSFYCWRYKPCGVERCVPKIKDCFTSVGENVESAYSKYQQIKHESQFVHRVNSPSRTTKETIEKFFAALSKEDAKLPSLYSFLDEGPAKPSDDISILIRYRLDSYKLAPTQSAVTPVHNLRLEISPRNQHLLPLIIYHAIAAKQEKSNFVLVTSKDQLPGGKQQLIPFRKPESGKEWSSVTRACWLVKDVTHVDAGLDLKQHFDEGMALLGNLNEPSVKSEDVAVELLSTKSDRVTVERPATPQDIKDGATSGIPIDLSPSTDKDNRGASDAPLHKKPRKPKTSPMRPKSALKKPPTLESTKDTNCLSLPEKEAPSTTTTPQPNSKSVESPPFDRAKCIQEIVENYNTFKAHADTIITPAPQGDNPFTFSDNDGFSVAVPQQPLTYFDYILQLHHFSKSRPANLVPFIMFVRATDKVLLSPDTIIDRNAHKFTVMQVDLTTQKFDYLTIKDLKTLLKYCRQLADHVKGLAGPIDDDLD